MTLISFYFLFVTNKFNYSHIIEVDDVMEDKINIHKEEASKGNWNGRPEISRRRKRIMRWRRLPRRKRRMRSRS